MRATLQGSLRASLIGCLAGGLALGIASPAVAQQVGAAPQEGVAAAEAVAKTFPQLVTPETAKVFGFASAEEAQRATVQTSLRIATIGLDRLKAANSSDSMGPLIVPSNAVRSFVVVGDKVAASVITRQINGAWQVARYGRPLLSGALAEGLRTRSAFQKSAPASVFELDIPALTLYFIAQQEGSRLMLVPAADDERFGFVKGQAVDSQTVMSKIVPYAKELRTGDHLVD